MWKFYSSDLSCNSDNTGSLTQYTTWELQIDLKKIFLSLGYNSHGHYTLIKCQIWQEDNNYKNYAHNDYQNI